MKILGIDPGYERVGIAIIESGGASKNSLVFSECFKTSPKDKLTERIKEIGQEIKKIILEYKPRSLAIEKLYFTKNQKTAMGVSEARGVIIYEASLAGLKVFEYTPMQVKIATTNYGKSDKNQVTEMVKRLIKIDKNIKHDDEYDAIGLALTCSASERF